MREAFKRMFSIDNVIVSIPVHDKSSVDISYEKKSDTAKKVFFYPAGPVINKNFEVLCEALTILGKEGVSNIVGIVTTNGKENRYTRSLYRKYKSLKNLRFEGFLKQEEMSRYYQQCDCLVFPSKIESWGLPVTEAKEYQKPILISDLPYSKETIGKYDKVKFFDPDNARQLAGLMNDFAKGNITYEQTEETKYNEPFARNWEELLRILFP
jgi:glycosyltransferase involved in cell wall biosynthesis